MSAENRKNPRAHEEDDWPRDVPRPPSEAELWQEDEPLESDPHVTQVLLLRDSLRHAMRDRPDVFVGANMPVYFSDLQVRNRDFRAPDLFVVTGTEPGPRNFWVVWREGGKSPDLVVEVLSDSTEETDRTTKMRIYEHVLKVSEYFLHDLYGPDGNGRLEGFRLGTQGRYEPISAEPDGQLHSEVLDLRLGLHPDTIDGHTCAWLRAFTRAGAVAPTSAEAERERAEAERERAEAERERAEAERERAEAERERAEALASENALLRERLDALLAGRPGAGSYDKPRGDE